MTTEAKVHNVTNINKSDSEIKQTIDDIIVEVLENTAIPEESELACSYFLIKGNKVMIYFKWIAEYELVFPETHWNDAEYKAVYREAYEIFNYKFPLFEQEVYTFLENNIETNF